MNDPPRTTATLDSGILATIAFVSSKYWKLNQPFTRSAPAARRGFGRPPVAMSSRS